MRIFWTDIIEPLIALQNPQVIVEIGSDEGKTTRLLLARGEHLGRTLHSIDPSTRFNVHELERRFPDQFVSHVSESLNTIESIDADVDLVLVDGDHNWYTVINELRQIERQATTRGRHFPLVLLHDVAWPYARRDLYYAPERIPAEHRQEYKQAGMLPGQSELVERGGLNADLTQATHEGGPKNGVLTGVEDYLNESDLALSFIQLPVWHGLGIIYSAQVAAANAKLETFLASLAHGETVQKLLGAAEKRTIDSILELRTLAHRNNSESRRDVVGQLKQRCESLQTHNNGLQLAALDLVKQLDEMSSRLSRSQADLRTRLSKSLKAQRT